MEESSKKDYATYNLLAKKRGFKIKMMPVLHCPTKKAISKYGKKIFFSFNTKR